MADDPTATLISNERMKLGATLLNNIAVALVVTGVIVPVVATACQMSVPHGRSFGLLMSYCGWRERWRTTRSGVTSSDG